MHIIFLSHYFPPEGNAPANRTFENCRRWVSKGCKVTVVTGVPNVPDGIIYQGYRNKLFQWEVMEGMDVLRVWTYIAPNKGVIRRILNYISFMFFSLMGVFLIKRGDLVIATSPQFFCAIGGYLFGKLKKIPFVLEIRDLWPESIVATEALKSKRIIRFLERLEMFLYQRAQKIIVVTESFKKKIAEKGISSDKIFVIKNGVDLAFFYPMERNNEIREKFNLQNKFVVSYIGTLGMAHGLDGVLKVAEMLRNEKKIVFLFVGSGAEKERLVCEKAKKKLDNVIFAGRQPKALMPLFYAASDICLVSLKKDDLFQTVIPSKIFEIMAMARPILLQVDGECRQIVECAKAGIFVDPEDEIKVKETVLAWHLQPGKFQELGRNGRKFVEQYFDRNQLADDYLEILKRGSM